MFCSESHATVTRSDYYELLNIQSPRSLVVYFIYIFRLALKVLDVGSLFVQLTNVSEIQQFVCLCFLLHVFSLVKNQEWMHILYLKFDCLLFKT